VPVEHTNFQYFLGGWSARLLLVVLAAFALGGASAHAQTAHRDPSGAFLIDSATGPVHFPACPGPITWSLDPSGIADSGTDVPAEVDRWQQAFTELAATTNYRFTQVAANDEFSPPHITITYASSAAYSASTGTPAGSGHVGSAGITAIGWNGTRWVAERAQVTFNVDQLRRWPAASGMRAWVIRHELAHALGLDHVAERGHLMAERYLPRVSPTTFEPTHITDLAALGRIDCPAAIG